MEKDQFVPFDDYIAKKERIHIFCFVFGFNWEYRHVIDDGDVGIPLVQKENVNYERF